MRGYVLDHLALQYLYMVSGGEQGQTFSPPVCSQSTPPKHPFYIIPCPLWCIVACKVFHTHTLTHTTIDFPHILVYIFYSSILFYPITSGGRRGTTDEFATIPFHLDLFSAALVELAQSIPVHSLILSSHLFFCLPLFSSPEPKAPGELIV